MKESTRESLLAYRIVGRPVGDFLQGVLTNNLVQAVCHADEENSRDLAEIAFYCLEELSCDCWGNKEKYLAWVAKGGLKGRNAEVVEA